ncbi:MAG: B12-binding domain-containing radical SAM protein [Sulfurimonas sp. RIFOXYD12_FULL_33_39]|uniref:B12-binding domain-containing radical SAM protein n=1 Tax=unclassified Sulfurimonas TaxID=2623549 RepID=UPI0008BCC44E|nr:MULTISPECIES: radical SAM protein [unclassified Sulfurimonas]OHE10295.1 MAG: B12-binding domain-containing radical SAM protein [Sulfurimonas sp. RIFOXYD12_FULL_33_39]OHE13128.1 MAG: B12-binding domain-containing radical SAM protein [Sulfurimonas sp. RIFOXYD2_FULL_34_21]DAB27728.1 MAG TPA: B12-binding domain-containing radical SAM protein [Sulfurimonas sp. UBA10385]
MRVLLITYDNESLIQWFPQGTAYIAAILLKHGHEVEIYEQDIHHYPESHLINKLDNEKYDVIGLSFIGGYYEYKKAIKISDAINSSKQKPFYIIGGFGPTPSPKYFLNKLQADALVMGEGEVTVIELLEFLKEKKDLKSVLGLAYRIGDKVHVNPSRPLIEDVDTIPMPAYHLFNIEHYRLMRLPGCSKTDFIMPVLSGRGCTFTCNFCYRMDKGFRGRSNESIIEEIKYLKDNYGITYIGFTDELLMSSISRTMSLSQAIIDANLDIKWDCNGRLNYAKPKVLQLMKKAGCVFINYGIEAYDDQILKNMDKVLTTKQIEEGIVATLKEGISPGYNIIFGNIDETKETLMKGVDFLLKYDDGAQMRTIRPVTPYPGSPLYHLAIEKGMIKDIEDFYENKHLNSDLLTCNFTKLTDNEFYEALLEANEKLLDNYQERVKKNTRKQLEDLYIKHDASFRGFRQS